MMHLPLGLTVAVGGLFRRQEQLHRFSGQCEGQLTYGPRDVTGKQIGFTARHARHGL